jgi:hypothetical protein
METVTTAVRFRVRVEPCSLIHCRRWNAVYSLSCRATATARMRLQVHRFQSAWHVAATAFRPLHTATAPPSHCGRRRPDVPAAPRTSAETCQSREGN